MATPEETAANLEAAKQAFEAAQAAHAEALQSAPARDFLEVAYDFFANLTMRFGNHPELQRLLDELKRALHLRGDTTPAPNPTPASPPPPTPPAA